MNFSYMARQVANVVSWALDETLTLIEDHAHARLTAVDGADRLARAEEDVEVDEPGLWRHLWAEVHPEQPAGSGHPPAGAGGLQSAIAAIAAVILRRHGVDNPRMVAEVVAAELLVHFEIEHRR